MDASPIIVVLNQAGLETARKLESAIPGSAVHGLAGRIRDADTLFSETIAHLQQLFLARYPIIGLCASGILIRALGPMLADKTKEPPVLAVSEDGASVVPLIGGHHGGNDLARALARILGGHAAVTTAGDTELGIALDQPPKGWRLSNPDDAKPVMAELLSGAPAAINGPAPWLENASLPLDPDAILKLTVTEAPVDGSPTELVYHPQNHVLGVGCARGCDPQELIDLAHRVLSEAQVAAGSVACVTSLDLKADEAAMSALAQALDVPFRVFSATRLEQEAPRLKNPSEVVFAETGCHGVSEGAALAGVGAEGVLVCEKRKTANATAALARAPQPVDPSRLGRTRGKLSVVSLGPGQDSWRTPEATQLLAEADDVVGYGLYLDLVKPHIAGKTHHVFQLGEEQERVRFALERAGEGRRVALICSGDAGIYAMGALVYELIDRDTDKGGVSDAAKRVEIVNAPGISALQAASARIGAPLGHDFCAISLSDLLTPWEAIEKRLKAAAEGDFVIAFYNPVSKRRRSQLAAAREILLQHRPPQTPVVLGVNLGRPSETVRMTTLDALTVDEVDMLTTVLVGSSNSLSGTRGDGTPYVFTPRGYAKRIDAPAPPEPQPAAEPEPAAGPLPAEEA